MPNLAALRAAVFSPSRKNRRGGRSNAPPHQGECGHQTCAVGVMCGGIIQNAALLDFFQQVAEGTTNPADIKQCVSSGIYFQADRKTNTLPSHLLFVSD